MSYTYETFVIALTISSVKQDPNINYAPLIPTFIIEAEQRCYRELNLLSTIIGDSSGISTPNQRAFTLPTVGGRFNVLQSINIVVGGTRTPLTKVSREVLDAIWPSDTAASSGTIPAKYAPFTDQVVLLGPPAGSALTIECIGTIIPETLSSANATTFLSLYAPDLFFSAAMLSVKNHFPDVLSVTDWEKSYQTQFASVNSDEMRRKFQAFAAGAT